MPELPDVENFKRYFKYTSLHKTIKDVVSTDKSLIEGAVFDDFREYLIGKSFSDAFRRGKFLIAEVEGSSKKVVFHFGMTGNLDYTKTGEGDSRSEELARVSFVFDNGYELRWVNTRKFGKIYFVDDLDEVDLLEEMGPEPLELSEDGFLSLMEAHSTKNIKSFLMDQRDIAGIGNVFSDEILFRTGISPKHQVKELDLGTRKELYKNMRDVLSEAVEVGPPEEEFSDSWLVAHRHGDMRCPKNLDHKLTKERVAGREAVYCPVCQI